MNLSDQTIISSQSNIQLVSQSPANISVSKKNEPKSASVNNRRGHSSNSQNKSLGGGGSIQQYNSVSAGNRNANISVNSVQVDRVNHSPLVLNNQQTSVQSAQPPQQESTNNYRNENILCAVLALLKELDESGLELVKRDIDRKLSTKKAVQGHK